MRFLFACALGASFLAGCGAASNVEPLEEQEEELRSAKSGYFEIWTESGWARGERYAAHRTSRLSTRCADESVESACPVANFDFSKVKLSAARISDVVADFTRLDLGTKVLLRGSLAMVDGKPTLKVTEVFQAPKSVDADPRGGSYYRFTTQPGGVHRTQLNLDNDPNRDFPNVDYASFGNAEDRARIAGLLDSPKGLLAYSTLGHDKVPTIGQAYFPVEE